MGTFNKWFLLLIVAGIMLIPASTFGQNNKNDNGYPLKVMSYNLRFGERATLEELAEYIKSENPDVVALQEMDVRTHRAQAPHQNGKDFITELGYLTGMLTAYARTIDYSGGYYGIGILSKYPFEKTQKVLLPIPEGSREQRAMLLADVELPGGKRFTFVSTHLDHSSSNVRKVQIEALNEALTNNPLPLIVAGDFNGKPDSPEINAGMQNWNRACNSDFTFPSNNPELKIDYIFYTPSANWTVKNAAVPKTQLSDHLPVTAEMELH
ncbi:endonuclease [Mariniphaga sediminis]|uniref:Endonuclease n=1 Tax=Mariniphaga sediminis TaxID=1628158 RepID=A0A399D201_9BACT|nr:endonuclease/exonuclease/phosphatase family protein [Mariniphaga sediminis]RIH66005.1 endonuclease [Mariniphaga sediminis]